MTEPEHDELEVAAMAIEKVRADLICSDVAEAGCDPFAEQHLIVALDALSTARAHLKLAQHHQARALAARVLGGLR